MFDTPAVVRVCLGPCDPLVARILEVGVRRRTDARVEFARVAGPQALPPGRALYLDPTMIAAVLGDVWSLWTTPERSRRGAVACWAPPAIPGPYYEPTPAVLVRVGPGPGPAALDPAWFTPVTHPGSAARGVLLAAAAASWMDLDAPGGFLWGLELNFAIRAGLVRTTEIHAAIARDALDPAAAKFALEGEDRGPKAYCHTPHRPRRIGAYCKDPYACRATA